METEEVPEEVPEGPDPEPAVELREDFELPAPDPRWSPLSYGGASPPPPGTLGKRTRYDAIQAAAPLGPDPETGALQNVRRFTSGSSRTAQETPRKRK